MSTVKVKVKISKFQRLIVGLFFEKGIEKYF